MHRGGSQREGTTNKGALKVSIFSLLKYWTDSTTEHLWSRCQEPLQNQEQEPETTTGDSVNPAKIIHLFEETLQKKITNSELSTACQIQYQV